MIICDDDKIFCSSFEDLVIEICRERNLKYEIFMFYETVKLKKFLEDNNDIDLIFLDIVMKIFLILMNTILLELSLNILVILKPFH